MDSNYTPRRAVFVDSLPYQVLNVLTLQNNGLRHECKKNNNCRHHDSVNITYDQNQHVEDRKQSLSHSSYGPHPPGFRPMTPRHEQESPYNYLVTEPALPYPVSKRKLSEAKSNFRSVFQCNDQTLQLLKDKCTEAELRQIENHDAHFIFGYSGPNFSTENKEQYSDKCRATRIFRGVEPAGKSIEILPPVGLKHMNISENTRDLLPDPHRANTDAVNTMRSPARRRHLGTSLTQPLPAHMASLMANDYRPMSFRRYSPAQVQLLQKYNDMTKKTIAPSHFFHYDKPGSNNMESTTMKDFLKPECSKGQQLLAAL